VASVANDTAAAPTAADRREDRRRELVCGVVLVAVGAFVFVESLHYSLGSLRRFGPGLFPAVLGVLVASLGLVVVANARRATGAFLQRFAPRPAFFVLMAILSFGLLVDSAGLAPAVATLVLLSALADRGQKAGEMVILYLVLLGAVYLVFAVLLGVPFRLVVGL